MMYCFSLLRFLFVAVFVCTFHNTQARDNVFVCPTSFSSGGASLSSVMTDNPVSSSFSKNTLLSVSYTNNYFLKELGEIGVAFVSPHEWGCISTALSAYGFELYNIIGLSARYSRFLSPVFLMGIGVELRSFYFDGLSERTYNPGITFGMAYVKKRLKLSMWGAYSEKIEKGYECLVSTSMSLNLKNNCFMYIDVNSLDFREMYYALGFSFEISQFSVRCGTRAFPMEPSAGFGFHLSDIEMDLSAKFNADLGVSMSAGVIFPF